MILILASGSPRRRALLARLGLPFTTVTPQVDEMPRPGESPGATAARLAAAKAQAVAAGRPDAVVLAADTVIDLDGELLGKPEDRAAAARMIARLAGRTHAVVTAVNIRQGERCVAFEETTQVTFAPLSPELIAAYAATGEGDDKSGAYAVQGLAAIFVERVAGSVTSVVGLPLSRVRRELTRFGLIPHTLRRPADDGS